MSWIKEHLHHFFVPSEGNNYRAKALHVDFLTYYLILSLVLSFSFRHILESNFGQTILGVATDITIDKLYQLTNNERLKGSLSLLTYNEKLAKAAEAKAKDMFYKNYWSHYSPDGTPPWDFILAAGYRYEYAGENLAKNFMFSNDVVEAWMNSKTHQENILRGDYQEVGFAVVNGVLNGEETTLVVQMFGKPLSLPLAKTSLVAEAKEEKTTQAAGVSSAEEEEAILPPVAKIEADQPGQESRLIKTAGTISADKGSIDLSVILVFVLLLALFLDLYFAHRLKVIRITGKNIAHFLFLSFILLALFFVTKGAIL